jgi:transcriptional regulator GlxA family with amidase domain
MVSSSLQRQGQDARLPHGTYRCGRGTTKHIVIVAPDDVRPLDVFGPLEIFAEASRIVGAECGYSVEVMGLTCQAITASGGSRIVPHRSLAHDMGPIDTLILAGTPEAKPDPAIGKWLEARIGLARRIGAAGTGVFQLAALGYLAGRRVTTHWQHVEALKAEHPDIIAKPNRIFVKDGPLYTSAGVTASMDLALSFVEEDFGRDLPLAIARSLVMFLKRPGGHDQISQHLAAQMAALPAIQHVQAYILDSLQADLSVGALAKRASMSTRNFSRAFRRETNTTPAAFVEAARLEAACRYLEDTDVTLQRVAYFCGFGTVDNMRRALMRRFGTGAHEYRKRCRDGQIQRHAMALPLTTDARRSQPTGTICAVA